MNAAWVSAKPLVLLKVMVSVDATFSLTVDGENAVLTVGAAGATVKGVGHAVTAVPAEDGALIVAAPCALNVTVPRSTWPAESVTVSINVPAPFTATLTCGELPPELIETPPLAVHIVEATVKLQAAALPLASKVVLPVAAITAIGLSAALTALSALIMPAPHCPDTQAHSTDGSDPLAPHWASPAGCGNGVALDLMRAMSCAGVKFSLTARISAAIPETMGAEKLVPRLGFA